MTFVNDGDYFLAMLEQAGHDHTIFPTLILGA